MIAVNADLHHLVLVAILLPERGIGEIHVGGHYPEQLGPPNLVAILRLEHRQILGRHARCQPALVLAEIELAVGLELGHALEVGGRRVADGFHHLVLADRDPAPAVLGVEDPSVHELVPDLVFDLGTVLQSQRGRRLPLAVVDGLLNRRLVGACVDALAVDLADRSGRPEAAPVDAGEDENKHQQGENRPGHLRAVPKCLHHRKNSNSGPVGEEG